MVLPQPDSPTRPSTSPAPTSRSTPSTARTSATARPKAPPCTGKVFTSPWPRAAADAHGASLGSLLGELVPADVHDRLRGPRGRCAGSSAPCARARPRPAPAFLGAPREPGSSTRPGSAGAKRHPGGRSMRFGTRPGMTEPLGRRWPITGTDPIRPWVYGCSGSRNSVPGVALLDDLPGVHHRHPLGHLGHDAEVVGDQHHGHAEVGLELAHQVEDLGLDGDVEGGGGLVGDEQLGAGGQRHGDHHPLGHARPRAGAGTPGPARLASGMPTLRSISTARLARRPSAWRSWISYTSPIWNPPGSRGSARSSAAGRPS